MKGPNMSRRFIAFLLVWGMILVFSAGRLPAQSFTLESVLSAPFPSDLAVSPRGDVIAWALDEQGQRNIWAAEAPDFKARKLTHFDADDGLEVSELNFNHEGTIIVFVRGQGLNRAGEYPNPTSNPRGTEQAVWAVRAAGGEPWRIGQGSGPVPSPSDNLIVFSQRGSLLVAALDASPKVEPLFKARGACQSYSFAADGSRLAFSSVRGDHAFIGIYDLKAKSICWVEPSVDRDVQPVFSPDGTRLAFFRFPSGRSDASDEEEGLPFSVLIADAATGAAREAWRSPNASGGFPQYYFPQPLRWAADGRLVFYSEHEGWMHLYSLDTADGRLQCLTPGDFEVEDSYLSKDLRTLVFNSNQGDIDRRHLWTVAAAGGTPKRLTSGQGLEWSPRMIADGQRVAFLCSTARQPAAPAVIGLQDRNRRLIAPELIPAGFPTQNLVEPEPIIFKSADGLSIHGQLFKPAGTKSGDRMPAVIFMHGGPIRQMLLGWHYMYYYHNCYALNQYLASRGYFVLSVNYRLGIGYGRAFREAPKGGAQGASEYLDIVAGAKYLQGRADVDPTRIGLWGGSYGGYLTALGLARDSSLFAAGVDLHGVHDWSAYLRTNSGFFAPANTEETVRVAFNSSPVASVDFWTSPVLFIHGDDDRNVEFSQTTDMVRRLRQLGQARIELIVLPDEIHDFLLHKNWLRVYRATADFFDRMMK